LVEGVEILFRGGEAGRQLHQMTSFYLRHQAKIGAPDWITVGSLTTTNLAAKPCCLCVFSSLRKKVANYKTGAQNGSSTAIRTLPIIQF
jgi:hypothetical protein